MKRVTLLFVIITLFAGMSAAGTIKYLAVVETGIDEASGASADLTSAEVRLITAELRREAVKNLPVDEYNVITAETIQSMGGAVLEECSEENCVITLGSKIGADYIVRGIVSKFKTRLTLSIETYETRNGNLVASADPVRSENAAGLLEKAGAASANMYRSFVTSRRNARKQPAAATNYTITASVNPAKSGYVSRYPNNETYTAGETVTVTATAYSGYTFTGWSGAATGRLNRLTLTMDGDKTVTANFYRQSVTPPAAPQPPPAQYTAKETTPAQTTENSRNNKTTVEPERKPMTGFTLGSSFYPDSASGHGAAQVGVVHSRPISEMPMSLNIEGNIMTGKANPDYIFFGFNVPVTVLFQLSVFSIEAGVDADLLFGGNETVTNAGVVTGAGIGFSKNQSRRYFYRYCHGIKYSTHVIGMRWLLF